MTNHYREAEELLNEYLELDGGQQVLNGLRLLLEAQVYATLALADEVYRAARLDRE